MCNDVVFGVFVLAMCGFIPVSCKFDCAPRKIVELVQTACKNENEAIVYAQDKNDRIEICRKFPLVLKCSVTTIPQCFDSIQEMYAEYAHSPFSCQLTQEEVTELQNIIRNGTQVTEVTPVPTAASKTSDSSRASVPEKHATDQVTWPSQTGSQTGSKEKHNNGNGADLVVLSSYSVVMLALVLARSLWRLRS